MGPGPEAVSRPVAHGANGYAAAGRPLQTAQGPSPATQKTCIYRRCMGSPGVVYADQFTYHSMIQDTACTTYHAPRATTACSERIARKRMHVTFCGPRLLFSVALCCD